MRVTFRRHRVVPSAMALILFAGALALPGSHVSAAPLLFTDDFDPGR